MSQYQLFYFFLFYIKFIYTVCKTPLIISSILDLYPQFMVDGSFSYIGKGKKNFLDNAWEDQFKSRTSTCKVCVAIWAIRPTLEFLFCEHIEKRKRES